MLGGAVGEWESILGNHLSLLSCGSGFLRRYSFHASLQSFHNVDHLSVPRRRRFVDHDLLAFDLLVQDTENADAILVFVNLRVELFRRKTVDSTYAEL